MRQDLWFSFEAKIHHLLVAKENKVVLLRFHEFRGFIHAHV